MMNMASQVQAAIMVMFLQVAGVAAQGADHLHEPGRRAMQVDQLAKVIETRRSIRAFQPRDVPAALVRRLVEAARWAPSAGNQQAWFFWEVRDAALRERLAVAAGGQRMLVEAPVTLLVTIDMERAERHYGRRGRELYAIQDAAAATQNMLLMAHAMGLGACWIGAFDEDAVGALVPHPRLRPVALVAIGYPAQSPAPPQRLPLDAIFDLLE